MVFENFGDAGYRSRYLSHAKRALYHLSYTPLTINGKGFDIINLDEIQYPIYLQYLEYPMNPQQAKLRSNIVSKPNSREGSTKLPRLYPPMFNRNSTIYTNGVHYI